MDKSHTPSSVSHLMFEDRKFAPPASFSSHAHIKNLSQYQQMYQDSIQNPNEFWLKYAKSLHCVIPPAKGASMNGTPIKILSGIPGSKMA